MTPYYQDSSVTLFHSDYREVLPLLTGGLVYVTDQPYGTGWVRGGGRAGEFKAKHERAEWDKWSLDWVPLLNSPKRIAAFCPVAKCEELCAALEFPAVLHYLKSNVRPGGTDREPIVCSPPPRFGKWKKLAYNGDMPLHPCQKPLEVMTWLVDLVSERGETVVDFFCGSGTTLVAAKELGRFAIGCDQDEEHCETATRRLQQEVLAL